MITIQPFRFIYKNKPLFVCCAIFQYILLINDDSGIDYNMVVSHAST